MQKEFRQIAWDADLAADWHELLRLAVREDLGEAGDWTTRALVPEDAIGRAAVVARQPGVLAGVSAAPMTLAAFDPRLRWSLTGARSETGPNLGSETGPNLGDGQTVVRGQEIGRIKGPARGLLAAERTLLNLLGRLSGIATLTRRYVEAVAGTRARIYDTRKTTPGWRRLEKYAVRCGGGWNHRTGLFEAILIKDNHLALGAEVLPEGRPRYSPADAVALARRFLGDRAGEMIIEVEVDALEQLDKVLAVGPDLVLLDNMTPEQLREAVARRNRKKSPDAAEIELEASGGVTFDSVRAIAATGVDRISVGALTHSALALDIGLDWLPSEPAA